MKYLNTFLNDLGESKFGIIIKNPKKFVRTVKNSDKQLLNLTLGYCFDEEYNLWHSKINCHNIMGVCCTGKYVITINHDMYDTTNRKDVYTEDNIQDLETLCDLLNSIGYKCKIGLVKKDCGCS